MSQLKNRYLHEAESLNTQIKNLKSKSRRYVTLEIVNFCLAVAAFTFYCIDGMKVSMLLATIALLGVYMLVRRADVLNDKNIKNMRKRLLVYSREIRYMSGDFSVFDSGERYSDPRHAFTFDMDVFGRKSLFNRINRTVTTGGSDALAHSLSTLPHSADEVERKREAVNELADNETWRTEFLARGQRLTDDGSANDEKIDSAAILRVICEVGSLGISRGFIHRTALIAAYEAIAGFYLMVIGAAFDIMPAAVPSILGTLMLFTVLGITARPLKLMMQAVDKLHAQMQSYVSLIRHIQAAEFKSAELKSLQAALFGKDYDALESFDSLVDITGRLDRRANILGLIVFNIAFMSDFFLVRRFLRWQGMYMERMTEWVDAVSRIDALVSMAVHRYNHPEASTADVIDDDKVVYEAAGLYHPFLGEGAVKNGFTIKDGNYYIITGANMAGKSTFLRSIGINYILAMNGMPVFADRVKVSLFNFFSSMRTTDDLSRGISYFNAELIRLRQLIESCKRNSRTLIILDEILKGTNSLDKLNGSRLFLEEISRLPVSGIIATHDLELSKMETERPERFHNYCFEIQPAENITYTYKITPGVARNQNATYLLKRIIKTI